MSKLYKDKEGKYIIKPGKETNVDGYTLKQHVIPAKIIEKWKIEKKFLQEDLKKKYKKQLKNIKDDKKVICVFYHGKNIVKTNERDELFCENCKWSQLDEDIGTEIEKDFHNICEKYLSNDKSEKNLEEKFNLICSAYSRLIQFRVTDDNTFNNVQVSVDNNNDGVVMLMDTSIATKENITNNYEQFYEKSRTENVQFIKDENTNTLKLHKQYRLKLLLGSYYQDFLKLSGRKIDEKYALFKYIATERFKLNCYLGFYTVNILPESQEEKWIVFKNTNIRFPLPSNGWLETVFPCFQMHSVNIISFSPDTIFIKEDKYKSINDNVARLLTELCEGLNVNPLTLVTREILKNISNCNWIIF